VLFCFRRGCNIEERKRERGEREKGRERETSIRGKFVEKSIA